MRPPIVEAAHRSSGHPVSPFLIGLALLLTVITPSIGLMNGAGSMALGVFAVSLGHIFVMLALPRRGAAWTGTTSSAIILFAALAMVLASSGVSLMIYSQADAARISGSLALFLTFAAGCLSIARSINFVDEQSFTKAARGVFYILALCGILGTLHISPFSSIHVKAVVFFTEPSHYALSFLPFLLFMVLSAQPRHRIPWVIFGLAIALGVENLSLLTGAMVIAPLVLRARYLLLFSPFAVAAGVFLSLDYYASRLDFSESSTNFSVLVFLGGWERAFLALRDTFGIGLGFQQFGVHGDQGLFTRIIVRLLGDRLNVLDGGTIGAKFVGEFGAIAVLLLAIYLVAFVRTALWLRRTNVLSIDKRDLFFMSCFLMFSIDIFVRGVAYFSSSGQLFLASLLWLTCQRADLFTGPRLGARLQVGPPNAPLPGVARA